MLYFLIGAGIAVVALCLHYSTETEEANCSCAFSSTDFSLPEENWEDQDLEDITTNPAYEDLGCNTWHDT